MGKLKPYKGRQSVRDAMRVLNHSRRFIILAEDENGVDMPLYCSGYPHESLVVNVLMKVAVGIMKQHKEEMAERAGELGLPVEGEAPLQLPPATEEEGREVEPYRGLTLPDGEDVPPAFGSAEKEDGLA